MTLTINLTHEEEAQLSREAAAHGLEISEYAQRLLRERLGRDKQAPNVEEASGEKPPFYTQATAEEWKRAFEEWSQGHDTTTPLLSDEALRREKMYEDRGL